MRALIRERIGSIDGAAKQLLTAAAIIGRSFDLATVRRASGRSDDETVEGLDQLVRRGLVREIAAERWEIRYDFSHGAFREAAYEATSLARRRLLHRRVADAVRDATARSPADALEHLALIAAHERAAGNDAAASLAFAEAGHLARKLAAPRDAVAHFETALAMGHPDAVAIQLALGEVSVLLGDYRRAFEAFETAAALAAPADVAAVELQLGRAHALHGDLDAATSHLDAALERAETAGAPDDLQARILLERGFVAFRLGRMNDAGAFASDALGRAERTDDLAARAAAERLVGVIATAVGDLPRARETLRRSLELSGGVADPEAGIAARNALALAEAAAGNRPDAVALLEAALDISQRAGSRHLEAAIENNLADVLHAAGDAEASMAHLKRAVALFADVGGTPGLLDPDVWRLAVW
jgi:tetratricopeptide (TPR) repeat protein